MKKIILLSLTLASVLSFSQSWNTTGNTGTASNTNFLGTTDNQDLVLKTNNVEWLRVNTKGRFILQNINVGAMGWNNNLYFGGGNDTSTGLANTALGLASLSYNTSGGANTGVGANSLRLVTTGSANTAIGTNTLLNNIAGSTNTALGVNALNGQGVLDNNTAVGAAALARYNAVSTNIIEGNTAVGQNALSGLLVGNSNSVLGKFAMINIGTGNNNIGIGYYAASNLTSGDNNIIIGNRTTTTSASVTNQLNIGNWIRGNNGVIGVGTSNLPADGVAVDGDKYRLFVKDGIRTEKVKVDIASANGWADYVFNNDYKLLTLEEVERQINENGHLPNIPSTQDVMKDGLNLGDITSKLLQKIEELTLYSIEQNKKINEQNKQNKELQLRLEKVEKVLSDKK